MSRKLVGLFYRVRGNVGDDRVVVVTEEGSYSHYLEGYAPEPQPFVSRAYARRIARDMRERGVENVRVCRVRVWVRR